MLNLAVLNIGAAPSQSSARLRDAAIARGHSITLLAAAELTLRLGAEGITLVHRGEELPHFDAVVPRLSAASDPFGVAALRHLEATGALALNRSEAVVLSHDKLATLQRLRHRGLPVPPTVAVHRPSELTRAITLVGGAPVVVKTVLGSQGVGVMLAETPAAASAIVETMVANNLAVVIQRFYPEARSSDIRAFVVGDTVVAAMRRTARPGEFRSNLHRGGSAEPISLDTHLSDLATRATEALGLHVAGVDIIETKIGPLVLEVNASPGLSGIEATTGVDVAAPIIAHLERLAAHPARS